ncbi:MAG: MFS transporter, partial [Chloroflexota bacterium]
EIPSEFRQNFKHLYLDMGWFGILSGSSLAFLSVYAARLGANPFQVGLMGAMPAFINLLFAIPAGQWLQKRTIGKAVFWTSVYYRFGYLLLIPLPWLFADQQQIWVLVALALLMGIPGTALAVGFNALFAEAVPASWRAHVAGIRNVILSIVYVITSILCGAILTNIPFPIGYQIVFGIGFLGAVMSSFHLYFVHPLLISKDTSTEPEINNSIPTSLKKGIRYWLNQVRLKLSKVNIWKTPFRKTLSVLLFFHIAQFLAIPLYPLYFVNVMHLNDQQIGIGSAAFYFTGLIGSMQLARISNKWGHHKVTSLGAFLTGLYPILLFFSHGYLQYLGISLIGGFGWAFVGGALVNYLLEKTPGNNWPAYLAWYNIILNSAILAGSILGPILAGYVGLGIALLIIGIFRLFSGLAILKWG